MTLEEFDNTKFHKGMKVLYGELEYHIVQVDFQEQLLCIDLNPYNKDGSVDWVRCENITLIP